MSARLYGPIRIDLNNGPITAEYTRTVDGKPCAVLVIGSGTESIAVSVTDATPEALVQLAVKVAELTAWVQRQAMKEVA